MGRKLEKKCIMCTFKSEFPDDFITLQTREGGICVSCVSLLAIKLELRKQAESDQRAVEEQTENGRHSVYAKGGGSRPIVRLY